MKQVSLIALSIALLCCSCQSDHESTSTFSPDNTEFQVFDIEAGIMDTSLRTSSGVVIQADFSEAPFNPNLPKSVRIKEFMSLEEIVLAGLSTVSDSGLLQSQGMIYLEVIQNGNLIDLNSPWGISIPVEYIEPGFTTYRAEGGPEGPGTWRLAEDVSPRQPVMENIIEGDSIFQASCFPCHRVNGDQRLIGWGLTGLVERRDWDWLVNITRNFPQMIVEGDPLAICHWHEGYKALMSAFPYLTEEEIANIYLYIENEKRRLSLPDKPMTLCEKDMIAAMDSFRRRDQIRDSIWRNTPRSPIIPGRRIFEGQEVWLYTMSALSGWNNCDRLQLTWGTYQVVDEFVIEMPDQQENVEVLLVYPDTMVINLRGVTENGKLALRTDPILSMLPVENHVLAIFSSIREGQTWIDIQEVSLIPRTKLSVNLDLMEKANLENLIQEEIFQFTTRNKNR